MHFIFIIWNNIKTQITVHNYKVLPIFFSHRSPLFCPLSSLLHFPAVSQAAYSRMYSSFSVSFQQFKVLSITWIGDTKMFMTVLHINLCSDETFKFYVPIMEVSDSVNYIWCYLPNKPPSLVCVSLMYFKMLFVHSQYSIVHS